MKMTDTDFENQLAHHTMIMRVATKARLLSEMPLEERLREQQRMTDQQRKRNCEFCKKYPEKCK